MELEAGRVAVITGAASGIGLAIAQRCAAVGMHVVLADIDAALLTEATAGIRDAGGSAEAVLTDVSQPAEIEKLANHAFTAGSVQLVVSNAGIVRPGRSWELPIEEWNRVLDINLMASIHVVRTFVPKLLETGERAHVLFTGSMASVTVRANNGPYYVAKHGLLALAETLHHELDEVGAPVGVTLLMPGLVITGMTGDFARQVPHSLTADEAGEVAMAAISADQLFAFTHPDRLDEVRVRFDAIVNQRNPPAGGF